MMKDRRSLGISMKGRDIKDSGMGLLSLTDPGGISHINSEGGEDSWFDPVTNLCDQNNLRFKWHVLGSRYSHKMS